MGSTAKIRAAPATRAPCTTHCPTPPQPTMVTVDPGLTAAVLSAEPTPVVTAQPINANCSSGRSVCTVTNEPSGTVIMSAKAPTDANAVTVFPSARRARGVSVRRNVSSQRCDWPRTQYKQFEQAGRPELTTRSPTPPRLPSAPTPHTTPLASYP